MATTIGLTFPVKESPKKGTKSVKEEKKPDKDKKEIKSSK